MFHFKQNLEKASNISYKCDVNALWNRVCIDTLKSKENSLFLETLVFPATVLHNSPCKLSSVGHCCSWGLSALLEGTSVVTAERGEESVTDYSSILSSVSGDCTQGSLGVPEACAQTLMCQ